MGLLDFQAVHWSKGMRDVQYFLIDSLAPDVLARHESRLIDHYVAELARRGIALDPELARERLPRVLVPDAHDGGRVATAWAV